MYATARDELLQDVLQMDVHGYESVDMVRERRFTPRVELKSKAGAASPSRRQVEL